MAHRNLRYRFLSCFNPLKVALQRGIASYHAIEGAISKKKIKIGMSSEEQIKFVFCVFFARENFGKVDISSVQSGLHFINVFIHSFKVMFPFFQKHKENPSLIYNTNRIFYTIIVIRGYALSASIQSGTCPALCEGRCAPQY